ncbi:MAG: recombination protein RecR [Bacteroidetes bacterium]|nr:MAG: recombination protein RecR [Bacteroidota bacterium]
MNYPSKLIEDAVVEISKLPSIGKKTAMRLVLHLLKQDPDVSIALAESLVNLRTKIRYCTECHHISDRAICSICEDDKRNQHTICVVEDTPDVIAIENTLQYNGLYHVLGGLIAPLDGISPSDLNIQTLIKRVSQGNVKEIIFALSATMESDTTAFYITKKLQDFDVKISTIARGIPVGSELEYTDEITLGRSILARVKYQ